MKYVKRFPVKQMTKEEWDEKFNRFVIINEDNVLKTMKAVVNEDNVIKFVAVD